MKRGNLFCIVGQACNNTITETIEISLRLMSNNNILFISGKCLIQQLRVNYKASKHEITTNTKIT
jgi:hypothetical protein